MSFLKKVVNGLLRESAQKTFVDQIHEDTGISKAKLDEVFHSGMSLMTSIDADPIVMGKSAVYQFIDALDDEEIVDEGDVVDINVARKNKKRKTVKHCTCPYDPEDDTKDVGTDPNCPYHGKNGKNVKEDARARKRKLPNASLDCEKCKGDGCKTCAFTGRKTLERVDEDASSARWVAMVDHILSTAMKHGLEPTDLQKKAERLERIGDPKAAVYLDAAQKYANTDVYKKEGDGHRDQVMRYPEKNDRRKKKKARGQRSLDRRMGDRRRFGNLQRSPLVDEDGDAERYYQIFDNQTQEPVSKKSTHVKRLRNRADKLDLKYGAIRYIVKPVEAD
ncbi:MAG: hypothetical protein DRI46_12985 [Chloroflexi bacterium]|nr:MAG: hypothetical protein DRI46_12985 [Chloroflexota bacterium]